ncbi:MAG: type II secretion system protein [Planctomycetota bacterium]|jgi:prepilin-type N-terminal cleavage/methylation domain-containing protein
MKLRNGFTLIELLVVIAVIGLLTAILIPSLAVAKERARRVVCSKNVNQFIIGCLTYAEDYDEDLPSGKSDMGNGDDEHTPVIRREVGNALVDILGDHQAMKCSWLTEPFNGDDWWYYDGYGYVLGYNYLGGHDGTPWNTSGPVTKEWKSPQFNTDSSTFVLVTELNFWVPNDRTFAPHGARGPINQYHESGTGGGMTPEEAGAAGGNVGMLDGSVTWKKMDEMDVYRGSRMHQCYAVW